MSDKLEIAVSAVIAKIGNVMWPPKTDRDMSTVHKHLHEAAQRYGVDRDELAKELVRRAGG